MCLGESAVIIYSLTSTYTPIGSTAGRKRRLTHLLSYCHMRTLNATPISSSTYLWHKMHLCNQLQLCVTHASTLILPLWMQLQYHLQIICDTKCICATNFNGAWHMLDRRGRGRSEKYAKKLKYIFKTSWAHSSKTCELSLKTTCVSNVRLFFALILLGIVS
jgi:hypothetical protein